MEHCRYATGERLRYKLVRSERVNHEPTNAVKNILLA